MSLEAVAVFQVRENETLEIRVFMPSFWHSRKSKVICVLQVTYFTESYVPGLNGRQSDIIKGISAIEGKTSGSAHWSEVLAPLLISQETLVKAVSSLSLSFHVF